jgi:hypothetical protein
MSRLSRKCGNLNISQPYGPPRHVTEVPLLTFLLNIVRFVFEPITVASRSKVRSYGIVGSNPTRDIEICLLFPVMSCVGSERPCDGLIYRATYQLSEQFITSEVTLNGERPVGLLHKVEDVAFGVGWGSHICDCPELRLASLMPCMHLYAAET